MKRSVLVLLSLVLVVGLITGCSDDDDETNSMLALSFLGLEDLGDDYVYEGWIMVDGTPRSTGTFTVDANGVSSKTSFMVNSNNLASATKFILTIEPIPDPSSDPAATKYLAGDFSGNSANLSVADPAALGNSFASGISGDYILNTPSTANTDDDYRGGIWWLDPMTGPGPTLSLPVLPAGWEYEGWVAGPSGPITTGRFIMASGVDSDGGGPTAGPDGIPPFPGQDYINPLLDLTTGYAAVISIEPHPDNSADPFTLKPLLDSDIADVGIGVRQSMANNSAAFPTGTAMR